MSKVQRDDTFKRNIYDGLVRTGYSKSYENFITKNSDVSEAFELWATLEENKIYEGDLDQFKEQFYGVKKKPVSVPSKESQEQSERDYVGTAGVTESGSHIENLSIRPTASKIGFGNYAGMRDFEQDNAVKQIKQMREERPGASIVEVKDDKGRPTLKFLEDHKEQVKAKATRVPDAAILDNQDANQAVEQYYQNKPDYLAMVKERKEKGYENTYNAGKFVDQGISDMQRDVRNAIDIKAKEIGKTVLSQYLNLNEQLKKTPETAREYPQLVADYQKFNQAHPDLAEYEGLVNKFWALDSKSKEARKNPAYKDYYANLDKKEQAQATADMFANIGMVNNDPTRNNPFLPAATKELYDLGTGLVRAAAGMQRWVTGSKYASLDNVLENMDQVLNPNNYSKTTTPSNRTQLVGQKYADVGDFKVLFDGDKVMGVVTKDGGYKVRDQGKVDEVMAAYERDKPKIKTQAINPYTATDVIIGGATQLGLGMVSAGVGAKLGKAGSMMSNFGSKATTIATNSAGTYNKLYNSAIQELGASNQKAAERYAGLAAIGMSMIGTLVNPLEQQLLGQIQKQSIRSLAKELGEGVAEQTAVRNATRMLLTGIKTIGKEGAEGVPEALLDDAVKAGVNKTMLKGDTEFEIDLPQDIIDNVWEETLGGLVGGSMTVNTNLSQLQKEAFQNAMTSPNRPKILARISEKYGKAAAKHYETVFAKAELTGRSPVDIHKEELVKAKTGEDYVAPAQTVPAQEEPGVAQPVETPPTQDERSAIVKDIADQIDLKPGQKITTPMGQTATIIGFDVDEADEDGEGAANNYLIRMDESGEETVVSIADYNKRVYEQGISQLQAQGMDRNEAEFAIEAARSVRGLNIGQDVSNVTESPVVDAPKDVEVVAKVAPPAVEESPVVADQSGAQSVVEDAIVEPEQNSGTIDSPSPNPELKPQGMVWTESKMKDNGYSLDRTLPSLGAQPGMPTLKQQQDLAEEGVDLSKVVFFTMEDGSVGVGVKQMAGVDKSEQVTFDEPPQPNEERVTPQDIALAQKLLGQAKSTLRGSIEALGGKAVKALKKYGDVKVVIHDTNAEIREAYKQATGKDAKMTGFYSPKTKTIHVSLESGNPAHTMLHEALHVFMRGMDEKAFNKLFDELVSIPEYTQVLRTKGRSPAQHAAMYPERWQKEEALVEYFAAIASGEIPVKKDSKVIQILNKLLKMLGFEAVVDNTNIRFIAEGLATALREGIEIERFGANDTEGEVAQEIIVDFPYYDEVAKLVELGLQKGLAGDKITQGIQNAFTAQGITADPNVINAVYQARSATFRKSKPITNKVLAKVKEIHSKLFVAMGGGKIREFSERLDGTIQRYVEQVNALISVAEKQSKGVDQDLVDRFLRDENSADEKQLIVDQVLRPNKISEEFIQQYQRGGATRYQRSETVKQLSEDTQAKLDKLNQRKAAINAIDLNTLYGTTPSTDEDVRKKIAEQLRNVGLVGFGNRYEAGQTTPSERKLVIDDLLRSIDREIQGLSDIQSNIASGSLQQFIDSKMNATDRDKVPDDLAETLTTMRMQIDNLSQYLIDEGYVVGERQDVIEKNLGQYMSDVYGIFKDKKFNPTKAAELKARKYFIEQIKNDPDKLAALAASGGNLDEKITEAAIRMVNDYKVKSKVSAGSFNAGTGAPVGKKSESIFKKKEGVPDELKDLLGKYNPLQEYAYTMYKLVSYVENSKFQRRLVNMGKGIFMWDKNDPARPEDANYELKGFASAKLQGDVNPLKGMMATKEVYDVLNGLDKDMFTLPPILKGFLKFQGWVNKMKTVYSYQTHFGNVIGNFFFMAFNGMLDLQTFSSINTARRATGRDFLGKYGTSTDEVEKVLTILKDEGVIGNEISIRAIRETVGRLEKSNNDSVGSQVGNKLIEADQKITDLYQAEDSMFKILAYLTERKRYANALYGRKYENLTPVEQEEVNRQATEIAKSNYPNYGRMGKLSQSLAKNNVIFGNFLSFTFEAVRTYGNTIGLARRELLSPNPKVKAIGAKRTAGLIAGSLAADGLLMGLGKVTGGVFGLLFSDKDDTKLNRDLRIGVPKFLKGGDLLFTPVRTGVYRVVDLSAKNPLLVFRRHFNALLYTPSDEETAKAVATQFLESFFSKPIAMKYVDSINNNDNQKDGKIWLDSDSSAERAEKIFMFTVKTIAPSSINSARKLAEADNFWVTAGNQVVGLNSYEIDYERVWGNKIRDYESLSDAYRGIRKELKTAASDDTVTDREFKEALKEYNVKRKAQMDKLLEIKASMMNIMPGKEGSEIIKSVIEESALSKAEKDYINTGKWSDYTKSRSELKYKQ